jgi:hypothetical protein
MPIVLFCPNSSSNALVRTYPIAKVLARKHRIQVLGSRFKDGIFPPYRDEFDYETRAARWMQAFDELRQHGLVR